MQTEYCRLHEIRTIAFVFVSFLLMKPDIRQNAVRNLESKRTSETRIPKTTITGYLAVHLCGDKCTARRRTSGERESAFGEFSQNAGGKVSTQL